MNFFLFISILDFLSILIKPIREYHFNDFPNFHIVGITLLFTTTIIRIYEAKNEGKDDYMESSREWRIRKDMLGPYDYFGPGPDYSNKIDNIFYFKCIILSIGLILAEVILKLNLSQ